MAAMETTAMETAAMDEQRYSRLIGVLGRTGISKLWSCNLLVLGAGGVGAEVCKNLLLSGVRSLVLVDDRAVEAGHLSSNAFLREDDVGRSMAEATSERLRGLNESAAVQAIHGQFHPDLLVNCSVLVATRGTYAEFGKWNEVCRSNGVCFIVALSKILSFCVFSDFGNSFQTVEPEEDVSSTLLIESITLDCPATVSVAEDHKHFLEDDDYVLFSDIQGMPELNDGKPRRITVTGASSFNIPDDTRQYEKFVAGGYIHKLPRKKMIHFQSFQSSIQSPDLVVSGSSQRNKSVQLHVAYAAIDSFIQTHGGKLPSTDVDLSELISLCKTISSNLKPTHRDDIDLRNPSRHSSLTHPSVFDEKTSDIPDIEESHSNYVLSEEELKALASGYYVELAPLVSIAGGMAAQEVIKACTGLGTPFQQWFYFDTFGSISLEIHNHSNQLQMNSRYHSQIQIFGEKFQQKLSTLNWFVVGVGSIGSEILKNLVLMGIGCNEAESKNEGRIVITDYDVVDRHNLPLQPLFRVFDVGQFKADVAARELQQLNPKANIQVHNSKMDAESENEFNASFFDSITGVTSAVDSSVSRLYLDSRCLFFRKPLVNGGKLSTKGSVQVFIPHLSEIYASTQDPPEHKDMPICTVKNFPYTSDHTLKWAMDSFCHLFVQRPKDVNSYLTNKSFLDPIVKQPPPAQLPILTMLNESLSQRPLGFDDCIRWARLLFEELFSNTIKQLCFNFPPDMKTSSGSAFWGGTKKSPRPLNFDPSEPLHLDFIIAASNLQGRLYGLKGFSERSKFIPVLNSVEVQHFVPLEGVKIAVTDNELNQDRKPKSFGLSAAESDDQAMLECQRILKELPPPASLVGYRLTPIEFNVDDENSFCKEFVLSAANLRAKNYSIPSCDKQKVYKAANIVSSLPTTGSVTAGLMCLEIYKLVQNKSLASYSHTYFNLQHPFFVHAQPLAATKYLVSTRHGKKLEWTLWDRFELDGIGMSLQDLLTNFSTLHGLEITMLSYGKSLLYAEFLQKKKLQERLKMSLVQLVTSVSKTSVAENETHLNFSISCTDAENEDVEVPDILVRIK